MFYRNRIKTFTKTKSLSNFIIPIFVILTFLLVIFNKTDYLLVNKIKSLSIDIITPITTIVTSPVKITTKTINSINQIRFLKQENTKLKEEVIRLKKWQTLALKNQSENFAFRKILNSANNDIKILKTAMVISESPKIYAKTVVINTGINDGISENLAIINEKGLVGKLISMTKNQSKILLITDQNSSVPVKTSSNNFYAIVKGSTNGNYLISSFIKGQAKPKIGDLLLTSGNTKTYPQNILVGKVVKVDKNSFIAIPFVDFNNLNYVQVIDYN
tara:strand:- start:12 stop:833 length:822 start_codon:yes stop_codon:yes gene_type:complete